MPSLSRADQDWPRAGRVLKERMAELGWNQVELCRRSGVSDATVRKLMRGMRQSYRPQSLAEISKAVGWPPQTLERVSRGEEAPRVADFLDRQLLLRRCTEIRRAVDALEDDLRRSG